MHPMLEIFGPRKDFGGRLVGDPRLNELGLHPARMLLSDACLRARRRQLAPLGAPELARDLLETGVAVVPDVLDQELFDVMRAEVGARIAELAEVHPLPTDGDRGFGKKRPFDGGFDRFDGGTLNRFVDIDPRRTPACRRALRDPRLARLCAFASGFRHRPDRFAIYQTVHGRQERRPDVQKVLHRDTFYSAIKLWLYLDPVEADDGPFVYVPGSHRLTRPRLAWEYRRARVAAEAEHVRHKGGSFRIDEAELPALGLPAPRAYPVAANTLVIADVRGFHRRGDAHPGRRRLSLYANLRRWPFAPVVY